jgi:hypothetical protein
MPVEDQVDIEAAEEDERWSIPEGILTWMEGSE